MFFSWLFVPLSSWSATCKITNLPALFAANSSSPREDSWGLKCLNSTGPKEWISLSFWSLKKKSHTNRSNNSLASLITSILLAKDPGPFLFFGEKHLASQSVDIPVCHIWIFGKLFDLFVDNSQHHNQIFLDLFA